MARGWDIVVRYEEPGISGALDLDERDEVVRLLKDAEAGNFDVVIFFHNDGLGRDQWESGMLGKRLRRSGVLVAFSQEGTIADIELPSDALLFSVGAWSAHIDYRNSNDKLAAGRHDVAMKGRWPGQIVPMGYKTLKEGPDKGRLVVWEEAADVVRVAFDLIIAGHTPTEAVAILNDRYDFAKFPKRGGERWSSGHVRTWILQDAYRGAAGTVGGEQRGFLKNLRKNLAEAPEAIWIPCPRIIDDETFQRAHEIVVSRRKAWRKRTAVGNQNNYDYPLAGHFFHAEAQAGGRMDSMTGIVPHGKARFLRFYECSASTATWKSRHADEHACGGFGLTRNNFRAKKVRAALVESVFILKMLEAFRDEDTLKRFVEESDRRAVAAERTADTLALALVAVSRLDAEEERAKLLFKKGLASEPELDTDITRIAAEREVADARVWRLRMEQQENEAYAQTLSDLLDMSISVLDVQPGDNRQADVIYSDGPVGDIEIVEAWGWNDVMEWLSDEAHACLHDPNRELAPEARDWIVRMVQSFDVTAVLTEDGDRTEPEPGVTKQKDPLVAFSGRISLGQVSPVTPLYGRLSFEKRMSRLMRKMLPLTFGSASTAGALSRRACPAASTKARAGAIQWASYWGRWASNHALVLLGEIPSRKASVSAGNPVNSAMVLLSGGGTRSCQVGATRLKPRGPALSFRHLTQRIQQARAVCMGASVRAAMPSLGHCFQSVGDVARIADLTSDGPKLLDGLSHAHRREARIGHKPRVEVKVLCDKRGRRWHLHRQRPRLEESGTPITIDGDQVEARRRLRCGRWFDHLRLGGLRRGRLRLCAAAARGDCEHGDS